MRIFMVCDDMLDRSRAPTTHVIELFRNLAKTDNILCFAPKPKNIKYDYPKIVYVPILNKAVLLSISYQLTLFFYLLYYCSKARPDVIYTRLSGLTLSPLIISKLFRIPYLVEINGLIIAEAKTRGRKLFIRFMQVEELNCKHAKKIVAVTQKIKEAIAVTYDIPDETIIVIPNGANIDFFKPAYQKKVRKELKLEAKVDYICFVGRFLANWHGIEYLIQAAPQILTSCPNTLFLIVGHGNKRDLEQLACDLGVLDKFIFTGNVPYENVSEYINASDVCVAPFIRARNERIGLSPLKIYEYLACGKSVVSSRIPNLEFIEEQNAGLLVEPENSEDLAEALIKLLKDKKLRGEMGRNGREYVVKNHSWESVARNVAEVCESAIREHKNKRG